VVIGGFSHFAAAQDAPPSQAARKVDDRVTGSSASYRGGTALLDYIVRVAALATADALIGASTMGNYEN
jgi:hypothetical protein